MNEKREKEIQERINDKVINLEDNLEKLTNLEIPEFEIYQKNLEKKLVCERLFEMIIEDIISITFLIIKEMELVSPENEEHAFLILSNSKIINPKLANRLREAKDMRNRIIHNYTTIDDSIVYSAVTEEIVRDAEEFIKEVKKAI